MNFFLKLNLFLIFIIFFNLQTFAQISEKLIGEQIWMTSNLNTSKFQNGDPIYEAKTKAQWDKASEDKKPAWCYYQNNAQNGVIYGKLYNWYAINDSRGLASIGWHIPSKSEWLELINYLKKGNNDVCEILKTKTGWKQYEYGGKEVGLDCNYCKGTGKIFSKLNYKYVMCPWCYGRGGNRRYVQKRTISGNGINSSGFAAKPGSLRYDDGDFNKYIGELGVWWTSSLAESDKLLAYYIYFDNEDSNPTIEEIDKGYGNAVRLVKDKSKEALEKEREISKSIIGSPIKVYNIEVAQYDFPKEMNWDDAKKACEALGEGWRLPTLDELNILYQNKDKIALSMYGYYWSSREDGGYSSWVWVKNLVSGYQDSFRKSTANHVRAIRDFNYLKSPE